MTEENTNKLPTPPRMSIEMQRRTLIQAIKTAPTEEIRKSMEKTLEQFNKKNN